MTYMALVDGEGNVVNNILAGKSYVPPAGLEAVPSGENISIGMRYDRVAQTFPVTPQLPASDERRDDIGIYIHPVAQPDAPSKIIEPADPVLADDGEWYQSWNVRAPTELEITERAGELQILVDIDAEKQRLKFVTDGTGQALEYGETNRELAALKNDPAPNPTNYPYLMADLGILGDSLHEIASKIDQMVADWYVAGPMIKRLRRQAKVSIQGAAENGDLESMEEAARIDWSGVDALLQKG